jgi:hypothetical protein
MASGNAGLGGGGRLLIAALALHSLPISGAVQCFNSVCDDGSALPCFAPQVAVHETIDCANAPAVSTYGEGRTARGNPYDACQKVRMQGPAYMGWGPEGDISYRCASTLESEQDDYHCGECNADGLGCANEYLGVGFDTAQGGAPHPSPASGSRSLPRAAAAPILGMSAR